LARVQSMSLPARLEQSILNAAIHRAYMLDEDEKAALLGAFLEMSYRIHREAVECMMPDSDYKQLILTNMQATEAQPAESAIAESFSDAATEEAAIESTYSGSLITKYLHTFRGIFRGRESVLQEEEELALFSTIEAISDQVHQEAFEAGIREGWSGETGFAAVYEREEDNPRDAAVLPMVKDVIGMRQNKNRLTGYRYGILDTYAEFMEEDYMHLGGIIDRNRAVSQGYLKAHA
jgi:hypothetical protein